MGDAAINKEVVLLRYFNKESHIESFRSGKIRMMSAKHYKEIEKNTSKLYDNRFDSLENSTFIYNPNPDGTIPLSEPLEILGDKYSKMWVLPGISIVPITIYNEDLDTITKIFCLYSMLMQDIVNRELSSCLSTMEDNLGDYYCLITNTNEFITRIKRGYSRYVVQKVVRNGCLNFVEYVDENNFNGSYGPFRKPSGLDWQREFRIKVETLNVDPFCLDIDSLKDITIWGKVCDLLNGKIDKNGILALDNYYR